MLPEQQQRIMGYFIEEAKDHLNTIEQGLLNLQGTIEDPEMVNEVFRAAHSVKGGAAMLGINSIQQTAHRLEDYFKILKEHPVQVDQTLETLCLRVFDTLQELLDQLQGPFGLTDDVSASMMAEVEPVFEQLRTHIDGLVQQADAAPQASPSASQISSSKAQLAQVFKQDVPMCLRDMLQLFKQPENLETRRQLQDLCAALRDYGEPFGLPGWCDLLDAARQAIANPDTTYRTLAPIIIKEIKQGQELVLANQAADIVVSGALQALLPTIPDPETTESDDLDLGDLDLSLDGAADLTSDAALELPDLDLSTDTDELADLGLATDPESAAPTESDFDDLFGDPPAATDLPAVDSAESDSSDSADLDLGLIDDIADDDGAAPGLLSDTELTQPGPEVGEAELNTLADLFEGDNASLEDAWQEEALLDANDSSHPAASDPGDDFQDLLFDAPPTDQGDGDGSAAGDEFADLLDDIGTETQAASADPDDAGADNLEIGGLDDLLSDLDEGKSATAEIAEQFPDIADEPDTPSPVSAALELDSLFDDEPLGTVGTASKPTDTVGALGAEPEGFDIPQSQDDDLSGLLGALDDSPVEADPELGDLFAESDADGTADHAAASDMDDVFGESVDAPGAEIAEMGALFDDNPDDAGDLEALDLFDAPSQESADSDMADLLGEAPDPEVDPSADAGMADLFEPPDTEDGGSDGLFDDLPDNVDGSTDLFAASPAPETDSDEIELLDDITADTTVSENLEDVLSDAAPDTDIGLDPLLEDVAVDPLGETLEEIPADSLDLEGVSLDAAADPGGLFETENPAGADKAMAADDNLDLASGQDGGQDDDLDNFFDTADNETAASSSTDSSPEDPWGEAFGEEFTNPATAEAKASTDDLTPNPTHGTEPSTPTDPWADAALSAEDIPPEDTLAEGTTNESSGLTAALNDLGLDGEDAIADPSLSGLDDLLGDGQAEDAAELSDGDLDLEQPDKTANLDSPDPGCDDVPSLSELEELATVEDVPEMVGVDDDLSMANLFGELSEPDNLGIADDGTDSDLDALVPDVNITSAQAEPETALSDVDLTDIPLDDVAPDDAESPEVDLANPVTEDDGFADLENLVDEPASGLDLPEPALDSAMDTDLPLDLSADTEEFADLEALLGDEIAAETAPAPEVESLTTSGAAGGDLDDEFSDLEKLLADADKTMGGPPSVKGARRGGRQTKQRSRPSRRGKNLGDQTMRVSVKNLDNLTNLVGELVVNRNSLEQDQERLRRSLDNLVAYTQHLNDVGQRMRDLYERSLLESSLAAGRKRFHDSFNAGNGELPVATETATGDPEDTSHATGIDFDDLEMDRFTGFHTLSQEMIELIVRVRESASDIAFTVEETDQVTRSFRQVSTQLQEGLTRSRMMPFSNTADRLPRAVRDISLQCGKEAELVVEGRDTPIDRMLLEQLYDPMTHLVNNAITHGIEPPEQRREAGKPTKGKITIRTFHQGNQTVILVSDDGGGIDADFVKSKAIQKGLITPQESAEMDRLDVYDLLFHPGFSTRDQADDFAGRGVGMDVVRTSLSEIRGTVSIDSEIGKGTTFTIRLPLTLSISKALICISNRARIAFPMDGVEDMVDVPSTQIQTNDDGKTCIQWRDTLLPFQPLADLLKYNRNMGRGSVYGGNQEEDLVSIVILRSAGTFMAIQVDQVLGEQEIVIKQLEGPIPKPTGVAGATVLGDGRIMPIADVLELIDLSLGKSRRESGSSLWEQDGGAETETPDVDAEPTVLIVDDSITVRELLSMTFNKVGYRVEQARDGMEAWEKLKSGLPCDIVFCDIEMPRMDGLELLSRIQKEDALNEIPIAMLTSRGADRHRNMATQLGAKGYFTKPYLEEALLDAAQRMLDGEVLLGGDE